MYVIIIMTSSRNRALMRGWFLIVQSVVRVSWQAEDDRKTDELSLIHFAKMNPTWHPPAT